ncbi:DUF1674 domain-containing protein [Elioraea sp.]|uniref:DUF1674 domain-containing protein n=1 Tax=Elioraea sp. TaxID=2185103 RepID=UPI0038CFC29A
MRQIPRTDDAMVVSRCGYIRPATAWHKAGTHHICPMSTDEKATPKPAPTLPAADAPRPPPAKEVGGPKGPEPTRYGDWEQKGRCTDF